MNDFNAAPRHSLSPNAINYWRREELISNLIAFVVLAVLFYLDWRFDWYNWIGWILIGLAIIFLIGLVWSVLSPPLTFKSWRYDLDEEFLYLQFGIWNRTEQLVPMTKIQAVSLTQGPLMRKYKLASLSVETMGSSHAIPALPKETAAELRERIAHFAKIKEVEQ
ncbi:membrane protein YdbS with pleckstrin-like domain [Planomicrobium stackebrandtii]|uniref:Membrane protein YdbS with pleckstrin-like domain n=1 Tax=Planomicrobium stackebrandtii TaxID=253160 RepID=A0ABU0GQ11_9BACL|nr:PH domain-containing protein [Planomicrobium stackebrandtii]MDQ0427422.1 membrane protein YdbS with pleckstrin-like domain [Planomicrobium stackebrandtii]